MQKLPLCSYVPFHNIVVFRTTRGRLPHVRVVGGWVDERALVVGVAIGNDWAFRVVLCKTTDPTFISYQVFSFVVLLARSPFDILSTHCPSFIRCFFSSTVGSIDIPIVTVHFLPSHWWTKKDLAPVHLYVHPTPGSDTKRHSDGVPQLKLIRSFVLKSTGSRTWYVESRVGTKGRLRNRGHSAICQPVFTCILSSCGRRKTKRSHVDAPRELKEPFP